LKWRGREGELPINCSVNILLTGNTVIHGNSFLVNVGVELLLHTCIVLSVSRDVM
jgi:hypothetical protein